MSKLSLKEQRILKRVLDLAKIHVNEKEKEIKESEAWKHEIHRNTATEMLNDIKKEIEEAGKILKRENLL